MQLLKSKARILQQFYHFFKKQKYILHCVFFVCGTRASWTLGCVANDNRVCAASTALTHRLLVGNTTQPALKLSGRRQFFLDVYIVACIRSQKPRAFCNRSASVQNVSVICTSRQAMPQPTALFRTIGMLRKKPYYYYTYSIWYLLLCLLDLVP